jgi:fatty acid desaturase
MSRRARPEFNAYLDRAARRLPPWAARLLGWLRRPWMVWLRVPLVLLLIAGGLVGFLPVLGFWMVPLGLLLLALDIPFLQGPLVRALQWGERRWNAWRRRRRARPG